MHDPDLCIIVVTNEHKNLVIIKKIAQIVGIDLLNYSPTLYTIVPTHGNPDIDI